MVVRRYRSVADIPDPPRACSVIEGLAAACEASNFSDAFGHRTRAPRGVQRFASVMEADAHRQQWESHRDETP